MADLVIGKIQEVKTAQSMVTDAMTDVIDDIQHIIIPEFSRNGDTQAVIKYAQIAENLKSYIKETTDIFAKFNTIMDYKCDDDEEERESQDTKEDIIQRTTWTIDKDNIRVITSRPGNGNGAPYTNIIPVNLFKEIVHTIFEQFKRYNNTEITTTTINIILINKIQKESKYLKSPKNVTYATFKVLLKENILERGSNSQRYTLNNDSQYTDSWLRKYGI